MVVTAFYSLGCERTIIQWDFLCQINTNSGLLRGRKDTWFFMLFTKNVTGFASIYIYYSCS